MENGRDPRVPGRTPTSLDLTELTTAELAPDHGTSGRGGHDGSFVPRSGASGPFSAHTSHPSGPPQPGSSGVRAHGSPGQSGPAAPTSTPLPFALPPRPTSVAETGLQMVLLEELALKHIVNVGVITGSDVAQRMHLPLAGVVEEAIAALRRDGLVEHLSASVTLLGAGSMKLRATERGAQLERSLREQSGYIGPAPVTLATYEQILRAQAASRRAVKRAEVWRHLAHLVLPDETVDSIGTGLESGGPLFLYGNAGNGKTAIGASIARMFPGGTLVPHAVLIDGHIVHVFDPSVHQPLPAESVSGGARLDDRWAPCRVPYLRTSADIRLQQLDLHFNEQHRYYECPIQLKAAGGVLFLDDLGRQGGSVDEVLDRLLEPLALGRDYMTTVSGRQLPIPFTTLLVFATSKEPAAMLSDPLLRRLPCKVLVPDPTEEQFRELFRRACASADLGLTAEGFEYVIERCYVRSKRSARACHPAELVRLVCATARYFGAPPQLLPQFIDMAADLYFV